jgi:hypothetical protein
LGYLYSVISYIVKGVRDLDIPSIRSLHICTIHSALTYTNLMVATMKGRNM